MDLILKSCFDEQWEEKFQMMMYHTKDCKDCNDEMCHKHQQSYNKLKQQYLKEKQSNIELYGNSVCGHYFKKELECILHNITCPALRNIRSNNHSCNKCVLFFMTATISSSVFKCHLGNWICRNCGYYLNYKLKGLV